MNEKSTEELIKAAQQALEALSLALSDVEWRSDSPTQPVIHKAYSKLQSALTQGVANDNSAAPGVPESPRQLRKRFEQHMRDVFACKDTAFLSIDGGKTYLDGGMDNHWRTWLAAQAKGAGHE